MDFTLPDGITQSLEQFGEFVDQHVGPDLPNWMREGAIPRKFFRRAGRAGWLGFRRSGSQCVERSNLEQAALLEHLAKVSPGVAVTLLVQVSLGMKGLLLFGSEELREVHREAAIQGETLICLGNTESTAGSDAAAIQTRAERVEGGWLLTGAKSYVTNGNMADLAVVTAVTHPEEARNQRISMFLVDLHRPGVSRAKLDKRVWVPSDLTRLNFEGVLVPEECLLGRRGRGLQQVLEIFTHSRVLIAAMTLGTAQGAFDLGLDRAENREIFGRTLRDLEAKSFEIADLHARLEAARLAVWRACWAMDQGQEFRLEAAVAKYLTVEIAREVGAWAADLYGASSVVYDHPIHKFPMDAWASSLGEGTQDVQKLVIFRELMKRRGERGA